MLLKPVTAHARSCRGQRSEAMCSFSLSLFPSLRIDSDQWAAGSGSPSSSLPSSSFRQLLFLSSPRPLSSPQSKWVNRPRGDPATHHFLHPLALKPSHQTDQSGTQPSPSHQPPPQSQTQPGAHFHSCPRSGSGEGGPAVERRGGVERARGFVIYERRPDLKGREEEGGSCPVLQRDPH